MKHRQNLGSHINIFLLFLIGFGLVGFGFRGTVFALADNWHGYPTAEPPPDEGFIPYSAPIISRGISFTGLESAAVPLTAPEIDPITTSSGAPSDTIESGWVEIRPGDPEPDTADPGGADPQATAAPPPVEQPLSLLIPSIKLEAPVVPATSQNVEIDNSDYIQWLAPDQFAAGWHTNSSLLGTVGNVVINGHHNVHGEVFKNLVNVKEGDLVVVRGELRDYLYIVVNVIIVPEKQVTTAERLENARWIAPSTDQRLTLITCWPETSNTHRLIVVARPVQRSP